jgi:hypothetical protein
LFFFFFCWIFLYSYTLIIWLLSVFFQSKVVDNINFRNFLELVPEVRELVNDFYSRYASIGKSLFPGSTVFLHYIIGVQACKENINFESIQFVFCFQIESYD